MYEKQFYTKISSGILAIILLITVTVYTSSAKNDNTIKTLDITEKVMSFLQSGDLTEEALIEYFDKNKTIMQSNIHQAALRYKKEELAELVKVCLPQYLENKDMILANYVKFTEARDDVLEKIRNTYTAALPEIVLVPGLGLYSNGGWAEDVDGVHYICVALERIPQKFDMRVLLAHEIAHGISEYERGTILGGFYNEGYATYISTVMCPGYDESLYFFANEEWISDCLDWINENRAKIYEDAGEKLEVMNDLHKLYFTTSYNKTHPNIGYLIGYEYMKYMDKKLTPDELRTIGKDEKKLKEEFKKFIFSASFERQ